jgi:hypothetical protein
LREAAGRDDGDEDDDDEEEPKQRSKAASEWRDVLARAAALPDDGEPVSAEVVAAAAAAAAGRPKRQCHRKSPLTDSDSDDDDDDDAYVYSPGGLGPYPNPERDMGPWTRPERRNAAIRYYSRDPKHDKVEDYFQDWTFQGVVLLDSDSGGHCLCGQTHLNNLYMFANDRSNKIIYLGGDCVAKCRKLKPGTFQTGDVIVDVDE